MLELNFSPFPEIRTKRLLLRRMTGADASALFSLRTNDKVMQFIGREKMKAIEEAETFIQKVNTSVDANESIMWAITLLEEPTAMIGTICFWNILTDHYRAEVGYVLHPDLWHKGIMKEAVAAVIDFGFKEMKLHGIEGHINPENVVSGIVLEKCGFVREAYFKENFYFKGKFFDSAVYSLLAK
jgi:ribosomal-protein-alanine N-acetyltransferase